MAESTNTQNKQACPICLQKLNTPRSIPSCKHRFCEHCLFTFVFNLKEKAEIESSFECPVCRLPCEMSESGEVTMEWIQTFPRMSDHENDTGNLPQTRVEKQQCGPCLDEDKAISGKKYCLDCQEYLCDECVIAHGKWKVLNKHKLLDPENTECSLEVYKAAQDLSKCLKHPDYVYELYCKDHEEQMCLMCAATSHKKCKNSLELSDRSSINEEKAAELKTRMERAEKHLSLLKQISGDSCDAVKAKVKSYRDDLQTAKDNIVKRLNEVVDNEYAFTKQVIIDVEDKTYACTQKVQNLQSIYKEKITFLNSIRQYLKPREMIVCVESLLNEAEEFETLIHTIESEIEVAGVDFKITNLMNNIIEKLTVDMIPESSVEHCQPKYLPLLEASQGRVFTIDEVDKHTVILINNCSPTYTNITVRQDGALVLCDNCSFRGNCGFAVVYDPQLKTKHTLRLKYPYCATSISETSVAVTVPNSKSIVTVRYCCASLKLNKTIVTKHTPKCIVALKDGNVAISWNNPLAFSLSDISGTEIQHVDFFTEDSAGRKFKTFDNLGINEKRQYVIQPCKVDKAVYCFTFKQQPVFKYENNLKEPRGVAVDPKSGCVFVCDYGDNCIHQVSVSGEPISVIRHDTLKNPLSVCYDGQRKCL